MALPSAASTQKLITLMARLHNTPSFGGTPNPGAKSAGAGQGPQDAPSEKSNFNAGTESSNQRVARVPYPKGKNRAFSKARSGSR